MFTGITAHILYQVIFLSSTFHRVLTLESFHNAFYIRSNEWSNPANVQKAAAPFTKYMYAHARIKQPVIVCFSCLCVNPAYCLVPACFFNMA